LGSESISCSDPIFLLPGNFQRPGGMVAGLDETFSAVILVESISRRGLQRVGDF
jgi:D-aminopeptidase